MMNKKTMALLLAVSTISTSMFALLGDIVEGTFDTAGVVATAPVDVLPDGTDRTWSEKREERHDRWRENAEDRRNRRDARRDRRHYSND